MGLAFDPERFKETYASLLTVRGAIFCALAVAVATVAGPFGTFTAMSLPVRLLYWGLICPGSVALGYTAFALSRALVDPEKPLLQTCWGIVVGTVLISGYVWGVSAINGFWGGLNAPGYRDLLPQVAIITFAVGVLQFLFRRAPVAEPEAPPPEAVMAAPKPRLARRLPPELDGDILHLSVSDHLVEVFTEAGSASLRMRFRDALDELDGVHGYRVHRSHWVAHEAVQGIERDQSRIYLRLPEGRRVPVSRNYRPALEEAGLL